jgi:hypothetical protein
LAGATSFEYATPRLRDVVPTREATLVHSETLLVAKVRAAGSKIRDGLPITAHPSVELVMAAADASSGMWADRGTLEE